MFPDPSLGSFCPGRTGHTNIFQNRDWRVYIFSGKNVQLFVHSDMDFGWGFPKGYENRDVSRY